MEALLYLPSSPDPNTQDIPYQGGISEISRQGE